MAYGDPIYSYSGKLIGYRGHHRNYSISEWKELRQSHPDTAFVDNIVDDIMGRLRDKPPLIKKSPEEREDDKMRMEAEMLRGDSWKHEATPLPFDLAEPIEDRIEFPKEVEEQLFKSTGMRYRYQEPYDLRIHFSQSEREERRREAGVGEDPLKNNPAFKQYKIMWEMAHKIMLWYAGWLSIGKEVCEWFEADLKEPTPLPSHIEENITTRVSQFESWRKRQIENPELENEASGLFTAMPPTYKERTAEAQPVILDGVPMWKAPDGSEWVNGNYWWKELSPAEKDHYRRQWQDGENDPQKWEPYQRDDEWKSS